MVYVTVQASQDTTRRAVDLLKRVINLYAFEEALPAKLADGRADPRFFFSLCVYTCVHACVRLPACMPVCLCVCVPVSVCVSACVRACVRACMRACMHACVCIGCRACGHQVLLCAIRGSILQYTTQCMHEMR